MIFSSAKKNHEKAVSKYNAAVADVQSKCDELNFTRNECVSALENIENIINSIAKTPRKLTRQVSKINIERIKYRDTKSYTKDIIINAAVSGAVGALSIGTLITAFKTSNLILKVIMLILSPILLLISVLFFRKKDKKIAINANSDAKQLNNAATQIRKNGAKIVKIHKETNSIHIKLIQQVTIAQPLFGRNFKELSKNEKAMLGTIVNNTLSLAEILNKKAEQ